MVAIVANRILILVDQLQIWLQQLQTILLNFFLRADNSENIYFAKSIFENIFCVLCNKSVPLKLKGKFYRVAIRLSLLYGSGCWPLRKVKERRLDTAKMCILHWIVVAS